MDQKQALNIVRQYKQHLNPKFADAKVYLFGSYSKGCANADSDIDVAVVLPTFNGDWLEANAMLWDSTWKVSTKIEPVLLAVDTPTPLYREVMHTGIVV